MRVCATEGCGNAARRHRTLCNTCRARRYENPLRRLFRNLKAHAKVRGKVFRLEFEEFAVVAEAGGYASFHGREAHRCHIDRIDVRRGYEPGNIQVLLASENARKRWEEYAPF